MPWPTLGALRPTLGPASPPLGALRPSFGPDDPRPGMPWPTLGALGPTLGPDRPSSGAAWPMLGPDRPRPGIVWPKRGAERPKRGPEQVLRPSEQRSPPSTRPTRGASRRFPGPAPARRGRVCRHDPSCQRTLPRSPPAGTVPGASSISHPFKGSIERRSRSRSDAYSCGIARISCARIDCALRNCFIPGKIPRPLSWSGIASTYNVPSSDVYTLRFTSREAEGSSPQSDSFPGTYLPVSHGASRGWVASTLPHRGVDDRLTADVRCEHSIE